MSVEERDAELIAYEAAYLERTGWHLYAGRWRDPETGVEHDRSVALGIQHIREHEAQRRRGVSLRLPATPPPQPAEDVPTVPTRKKG